MEKEKNGRDERPGCSFVVFVVDSKHAFGTEARTVVCKLHSLCAPGSQLAQRRGSTNHGASRASLRSADENSHDDSVGSRPDCANEAVSVRDFERRPRYLPGRVALRKPKDSLIIGRARANPRFRGLYLYSNSDAQKTNRPAWDRGAHRCRR